MNRILRRALLAAAVPCAAAAFACAAAAQGEPAPGAPSRAPGPPVEAITTASSLSTEPLGAITGVRELADGRILVNDGARRRLLLMDSTLQMVGVVLDSLTDVATTYGTRPGMLIPYRADSTLFVDPASYAMLVLDPAGRLVRVRSVWRVQDLPYVMNQRGPYGWPAVDARGRVVYRVAAITPPPRIPPPGGVPYFPADPDSAFVVAVDLDTRTADTLATLRTPKTAMTVRRTGDGRYSVDNAINPLPASDDWAVLADGTVAVVRAQDYRVEYLGADGTLASSPKLPYEWQRVTDEDKQRIVDSVRVEQQKSAATEYATATIRWVNTVNRPYPQGFAVPQGYVPPPGFIARGWELPPGMTLPATYAYACAPGEQPAMRPRPEGPPAPGATVVVGGTAPTGAGPGGAPGSTSSGTPACVAPPTVFFSGGTPPPPALRQVSVLPASELPDYRPPIASGGSARADLDGNLWIRAVPVRRVPGGPVYDVVDRQGEMVTRLQLPQGYTLVGFGRGKVVYLSVRDAAGMHLARVRLR
ncbi:MAG TPA: hypothetical protein VGB24_00580 [Longimicrobium sp.]|jgi:hypothetical protein|uniref:hypothetical protein n=1 Tax=Longimicrobium sp. TaxID=2029185 RepID=UPI002ED91C2F